VLEVDRRDGDEHGTEERGDRGFRGQTECKHAAGDEQSGGELNARIQERDSRLAMTAAPTQQGIRDQREIVVPVDLLSARHAGRRRPDDRAAERHPRGDDVQKATERQAGGECNGCKGVIHVLRIGSLSP
jgi:hypothetical protein